MKESRGTSQKHQCLTRVLRGASELARQMRGEKIPLRCSVMNAFPCKGAGPLLVVVARRKGYRSNRRSKQIEVLDLEGTFLSCLGVWTGLEPTGNGEPSNGGEHN